MTVTRATSLLFLFRSKIEEAVGLVPSMRAEEKLKSVQFWNAVSEKLQEIVNSSAADINALGLKFENHSSEKMILDTDSDVTSLISQTTICPDFINSPSSFNVSEESNHQSQEAVSRRNSAKSISNNMTITTEKIENEMSCNRPHQLSQEIHGERLTKGSCASNTAVNILNPQSLLNSDVLVENSESSSEIFAKTTILKPGTRSCINQLRNNIVTRKKRQNKKSKSSPTLNKQQILKRLLSSKSSNIVEQVCNVKKGLIKRSKSRSDNENRTTIVSDLSESSKEGFFPNVSSLSCGNSDESTFSEHVVSFVISNTEEILANNQENVKFSSSKNDIKGKSLSHELCDEQFLDDSSLTSQHWNQSKQFTCNECPAQFSTKGNLIVHMRKHTGEKPYCCPECYSKFTTKGNLKRHIKTHSGEKPWQCDQCDSCFTEKKSLTVHQRRHTGEKPYECQVCGKKFAQSGILQTHMAMHNDHKAHLCEHCGKSFRQKSQLRLHKLRHDGVKKFVCASCPSKFLTKGDLERHARIHTGERPFNCELCNKGFTRQQSLNEHRNRHYGLTPYDCKYCDKSFAEMSACYKHIKQHEKSEDDDSKFDNEQNFLQVATSVSGLCISSTRSVGNKLQKECVQEQTGNFAIILNTSGNIIEDIDHIQSQTNQTITLITSATDDNLNVNSGLATMNL